MMYNTIILIFSAFLRWRNKMKIVNCGYNYVHNESFKIQRESGSGDFLLLVLRSPAYFYLQGREHISKSNSVIVFRKGTAQIYGAHGGQFINDWVHFEVDAEDLKWMGDIGIELDTVTELSNVLPLSVIIKQMFAEFYSNNKNAEASAHHMFSLLFLKISDLCNHIENNRNPFWYDALSKLRSDIFADPHNSWNIDGIAERLSVSNSYLQHLYKLYFGKSIKQDVTLSRLEYAKYLLLSTECTISAVSLQCGYSNDVHFMRIFKQSTGMTPTEYRNRQACSKNKMDSSKNKNPYCL